METIVPIPTLPSLTVHAWLVPISLTLVALLKLVAGLVVMMMHGTVAGLVVMMMMHGTVARLVVMLMHEMVPTKRKYVPDLVEMFFVACFSLFHNLYLRIPTSFHAHKHPILSLDLRRNLMLGDFRIQSQPLSEQHCYRRTLQKL